MKLQVKVRGKEAMDLRVSFDEAEVLTENLPFITSNLKVPEVVVINCADADTSDKDQAVAVEKAAPGKPTFLFTWEQSK